MRRRKGPDEIDCVLLIIAIIFGIIVYIGMYAPWIYTLAWIGFAVWGVYKIAEFITENTPLTNIASARIINRTEFMKDKYVESGYSHAWGVWGSGRTYWKRKRVPTRIIVEFEVRFKDGTVQQVSTNEGSVRYRSIIPYLV